MKRAMFCLLLWSFPAVAEDLTYSHRSLDSNAEQVEIERCIANGKDGFIMHKQDHDYEKHTMNRIWTVNAKEACTLGRVYEKYKKSATFSCLCRPLEHK